MAEDCIIIDELFFRGEDVFEIDEKRIEEASREIFTASTIKSEYDTLGEKTETYLKIGSVETDFATDTYDTDFSEGMDLFLI